MHPRCIFRKSLVPLQNIVRRKRRYIRCSSYVVTRRPMVVKDMVMRSSINTSAALALYANEQGMSIIHLSSMEHFISGTIKVQLVSLLFHLVYDVLFEYITYYFRIPKCEPRVSPICPPLCEDEPFSTATASCVIEETTTTTCVVEKTVTTCYVEETVTIMPSSPNVNTSDTLETTLETTIETTLETTVETTLE